MAEEENVALRGESEYWVINAHVHGKVLAISAGGAGQRVRWLGHVAIARWDEEHDQGWKRLGIPTTIRAHNPDGTEIDMNMIIKDALQNGDHIFVSTSLQPNETA